MARRQTAKPKPVTDAPPFPYNWTLKDAVFTKDKGKVLSTFACGGGSTMGYKLAGYDVIGCVEIDETVGKVYIENHKPKHPFIEPIQDFIKRKKFPKEFYNLDILDGSPPCSSFSISGNGEDDWGKKKKFREGQKEQVLDTLFFDYIELARLLQPKVAVAENVMGLLMDRAKSYVRRIYEDFDKAGYYVQQYVLDASLMGVPQRRERVFFIGIRKDLAGPFLKQIDLFSTKPILDLSFNYKTIKFGEIYQEGTPIDKDTMINLAQHKRWELREQGDKSLADCDTRYRGKGSFFNVVFLYKNQVMPTFPATRAGWPILFDEPRTCSVKEICLAGSFPTDYNFMDQEAGYMVGMCVPPVMTANIANQIWLQWLSKLK